MTSKSLARRRACRFAKAILCAMAIAGAHAPVSAAESSYGMDDFSRVEKIDAHIHVHGRAERLMSKAVTDHFSLLTINVDYPDFPPLPEQLADAVDLRRRHPGRVAFAGAFSVAGFPSPGWSGRALHQIDDAVAKGAVGIKIWKNIGMSLQDPDGRYVMLDDARFDPMLRRIEKDGIVLLTHQAEPLNCWLPMEKMTVRSDREYFQEHPQYYMYRHPEMPSHDTILAARDRMMAAHPGLRVDAVHLASLEWDVDRVAGFLERFPTARVDMAARLVHLEYQAAKDRAKVRTFLIRYQDRILYGSDDAYGPEDSDRAADDVHRGWVEDWRFLVTAQGMSSPDFKGAFHGLQLPRSVVDKLYRRNAETMFRGAWTIVPASPAGPAP